MLSTAHILAMDSKNLLDVIDNLRAQHYQETQKSTNGDDTLVESVLEEEKSLDQTQEESNS